MAAASGLPIRMINIKCDNAGEFLSREFKKMLTNKGIHQTICPLNGVAERAIRSGKSRSDYSLRATGEQLTRLACR